MTSASKIGLKLASYTTDNKVTITDNVYNLLNTALNYVLNRINWRVEIGSRKRKEVPEIPEKALREIIVNSFAHANYEKIPEIEIGIHLGKIEIYNPGTFPDDLTPLDFISKNLPSYKRNRLILDILFRSKDVEKSGTGFQRVNELCMFQNVSWTYRKEAYGFFFEFIRTNVHLNVHINVELTNQEQVVYNLIESNEKISSMVRNPLILKTLFLSEDVESYSSGFKRVYDECGKNNVKIDYMINREGFTFIFKRNVVNSVANNVINMKLSNDEKMIVEILKSNPNYTAAKLATLINKNPRSIQRILSSLKNKNIIERVGGTRGYWKVVK